MKGIFLLDIEVELAWGLIDQQFDKHRLNKASRTVRKHLDTILSILEKHQVQVTWGVLGHVALDHCERMTIPHPEMPRPSYKWLKRDWYESDPGSALKDEPAFYGKDIVDRIVDFTSKTNVTHDIACHSFSHQLFGDAGCSKKVAEAEVKKCIEILEGNYRIHPKVFIFPRDFPGHLDVLRKNGFIAFRGPIPRVLTYSESPQGIWGKTLNFASQASYWASFYACVPPPVVQPFNQGGLINIPGSMCYNQKPFIPLKLIQMKVRKGIERAVREDRVFHLYSHLINFGDAPHLLKGFEKILDFADTYRNKKQLEITTIKELAESGLNG